tara:strand:- start:16 stop:237 length:222 start_codon:yes stop_codon:yes gene_type:complete
MTIFDEAWNLLKEDMEKEKKQIIECLKKEGGACGLDECCKASGLDRKKCKALIDKMDNVKIHKYGDVVLMDGL